jgi:predicted amidohydrolase
MRGSDDFHGADSDASPAPWKLAVAQIEVVQGDVAGNVARCVASVDEAAAKGARMLVLPECAITGYAFEDAEAAQRAAVEVEGAALDSLRMRCAELGVYCVVGLIERVGVEIANAAVLFDDRGELAGMYRKAHLPCLGVDRFAMSGDLPPPVIETAIGRIGINICYDIRFAESARVTALKGADVIAHPANWPSEAAILGQHFVIVRAAENRVFVAAANRGDSEGGIEFAGLSQIVDPTGQVRAKADREPAVLVTDVDVVAARSKRTVRRPGAYETDIFADRRPELYGDLVAPRPETHPSATETRSKR